MIGIEGDTTVFPLNQLPKKLKDPLLDPVIKQILVSIKSTSEEAKRKIEKRQVVKDLLVSIKSTSEEAKSAEDMLDDLKANSFPLNQLPKKLKVSRYL